MDRKPPKRGNSNWKPKWSFLNEEDPTDDSDSEWQPQWSPVSFSPERREEDEDSIATESTPSPSLSQASESLVSLSNDEDSAVGTAPDSSGKESPVDSTPDSPISEDYSKYYTLEVRAAHGSKKLKTDVQDVMVKFQGLRHLRASAMLAKFRPIFAHIMGTLTSNLAPSDYVRIVLENSALNQPIGVAYQRMDALDVGQLFDEIERVLNSYQNLAIDGSTRLTVTKTYFPEPGAGDRRDGFRNRKEAQLPLWLKEKQSVIRPASALDELCGYRCIAIGQALCDKVKSSFRYSKKWQDERAAEIYTCAELEPVALDLTGITKIQAKMSNYQIYVWEIGLQELNLIYSGDEQLRKIHLLLHDGHYYTLRNLHALCGKRKTCPECFQLFNDDHQCPKKKRCKLCKNKLCRNSGRDPISKTVCAGCDVQFFTESCLKIHDCARRARCTECDTVVLRTKLANHRCGMVFCRKCACWRKKWDDHIHFLPVYRPKKSKANIQDVVFYFDFETKCDKKTKQVQAVMCVIEKECGTQSWCFYGDNTVNDFLDMLQKLPLDGYRYTWCAHYGSGFDFFLPLAKLYERKMVPQIIFRGSKIIYMTLLQGSHRFVDTYQFVPLPLRDFSKSFGLNHIEKGRFPFKIVDEYPLTASIDFPSIDFFDPQSLKPADKTDLISWHQKEQAAFEGKSYHILSQMRYYCTMDSRILRLGMEKFRACYLQQYKLDCLLECFTMTQANYLVWRRDYIGKKDDPGTSTVALISDFGILNVKSSGLCAAWLEYCSQKEGGLKIIGQHNGFERRVSAYRVDGMSDTSPTVLYKFKKPGPTIWQFYGCAMHGCLLCFPNNRQTVFLGKSYGARYATTMRISNFLHERSGMNLVECWEHEYKQLLITDIDLKALHRRFGCGNRALVPRNAYFGGRVEVMAALHKCKKGQRIYLMDFNSLYPAQMYSKKFFIGAPTKIMRSDFGDITLLNGLACVKVVGPRQLMFPVLPYRCSNNRLMFPTCRVCAETNQSTICEHDDESRSFVGEYTLEELKLALNFGYRILRIFEVWAWDDDATSSSIFRPFVADCVRRKAQASGYLSYAKGDPEKEAAYIREYAEKYDIQLDPSEIEFNPSMRLLNKLSMNALSGRLGLKLLKNEVKYFTEFDTLRRIIEDEGCTISDVHILNEDMGLVVYTKDGAQAEEHLINLPMIIQITSGARIALYEAIHTAYIAGAKCLYVDTDSLVLCLEEGMEMPFESSDCLGALKNETTAEYGEGAYIDMFFAVAPKAYGYRVRLPDGSVRVVLKIKGFRLDSATLELITQELMERMILMNSEDEKLIIKYDRRIKRDIRQGVMTERTETKTFRMVQRKRILRPDLDWITLPFGY